MKKVIIMPLILAAMAISSVVFAEQLTNWEQEVYNYSIEKSYANPHKKFNDIYADVAQHYSIPAEQVKQIAGKGEARELSQKEYEINSEFWTRYADLPKGAPDSEYKKIYEGLGRKYGMSGLQIYEISSRSSSELY